MSRVVLISTAGPARGFDPASWRLRQVAAIYRRGGWPVDLVLTGPGVSEGDILAGQAVCDRVALAADGLGGGAGRLLRRLCQPARPRAVHLIGPVAGRGLAAPPDGTLIVSDIAAGGPPDLAADLVLAGSDAALTQAGAAGRGLRLPWVPPPRSWVEAQRPDRAAATGQGVIGWAGPGGAALAAGWSAFLAALAARRGSWPGGVLLAGDWAASVEVPPQMRGVRRMADPATAFGALDLAVLPAAAEAGADMVIAAAIRRRLPVLAPDAAAGLFADRWRFARPGSVAAMAEAVALRGIAAAAPEGADLARALDAAATEMDRDGAAMEAYFLERFAALAGAVTRP